MSGEFQYDRSEDRFGKMARHVIVGNDPTSESVPVSGSFQPLGLGHAVLSKVTLDAITWVEVNLGLSPRSNVAVQNISSDINAVVLWNYSGTGSDGWQISKGGSKSVTILNTATSKVYVKMLSGTGTAIFEEIGP